MADGPGSLFERYDPEGALGGLFAPAYIAGYAPSGQAVQAWQAQQRPVSANMIDELRMPEPFAYPNAANMYAAAGAGNVYGEGRIPRNLTFGDRRGRVDPAVLRAAAMGGPIDVQSRRDAIAERVAANERAATGSAAFGPWTGAQLTESQWSTPDAVGPAFGAALQSQGLMPRHLRYNPQTRAWEAPENGGDEALLAGGG